MTVVVCVGRPGFWAPLGFVLRGVLKSLTGLYRNDVDMAIVLRGKRRHGVRNWPEGKGMDGFLQDPREGPGSKVLIAHTPGIRDTIFVFLPDGSPKVPSKNVLDVLSRADVVIVDFPEAARFAAHAGPFVTRYIVLNHGYPHFRKRCPYTASIDAVRAEIRRGVQEVLGVDTKRATDIAESVSITMLGDGYRSLFKDEIVAAVCAVMEASPDIRGLPSRSVVAEMLLKRFKGALREARWYHLESLL